MYNSQLDEWQNRWSVSTKATWTHRLIPDVRLRMKLPIRTKHHLSQFLTGRGNFKLKLYKLGLVNSPMCVCEEQGETLEHVLYYCPRRDIQRENLINSIRSSNILWPCEPSAFQSSRKLFNAFEAFEKSAIINTEN